MRKYVNSPIAEFTLIDDIAKGIPIPHTPLRLPQKQMSRSPYAFIPRPSIDSAYLTVNQNGIRSAGRSMAKHDHRAKNLLSRVEELNPKYMDELTLNDLDELNSLPSNNFPGQKYMADASEHIDKAVADSGAYNNSKKEITRLARKYSNTPYNVRQRELGNRL